MDANIDESFCELSPVISKQDIYLARESSRQDLGDGNHTEPRTDCATPETLSIRIRNLEIRGFIKQSTGVANFLNIPFARIPARFRQAILIDPREESGIIDALNYGPRCPQPDAPILNEYLYPEVFTKRPESEFSCLNLNIYAPAKALTSNSKLPVIAWIHGGAYTYGDNSVQYDGNYLVRRSVEVENPIILISINYRLGLFGFFTSKELKEEAKQNGEDGFSNQGLHDQRLALQWIKNNVHYFGGDGDRVTGAGESGGAFSVVSHMSSDFPAFQQAFIMSFPAHGLQSYSDQQQTFNRLVESTGVSASAPADEKLAAIRRLSIQQMGGFLEEMEGSHASPIWDEQFFTSLEGSSILDIRRKLPAWVKMIAVGTTRDESAVFSSAWKSMGATELIQRLRDLVSDDGFVNDIFVTYGITESSPQADIVEAYIKLTTDGCFSIGAHNIGCQKTSRPVFMYSFDQEDLTQHFLGYSYHSFANPFLFLIPTVAGLDAPEDWRKTAYAFADSCISLVCGQEPWQRFDIANLTMSFNGGRTGLTKHSGFLRWKSLASTKERENLFRSSIGLVQDALSVVAAAEL